MPLQIRRGNNAERQQVTPAVGELIYVTDTKVIFIGDGVTQGGVPVTNFSASTIKDLSAEVLTQGIHNGIAFTYDSVTNRISATVEPDLANYEGTISASAFKGSFFADDSTRLLNGIDGSINLNGTVKTNVIPGTDGNLDLGSPSFRFNELYLAGPALFIGAAQINAVGSIINLPAGSTVAGVPIGSGGGISGDGVVEGNNYRINIYGADSTIMVDTDNGYLKGDLEGSIKGNVFSPDNSSLVLNSETATLNGTLNGPVENASLSITTGGAIIGKRTFGGIDSPVDIGTLTTPSTLQIFSNQRLVQGYGTTDGNRSGDFEVSISRGTPSSPVTVQAGDTLGGLRYEAHDGTDYRFASQLNFLIDPRSIPSNGIEAVASLDFPQSSSPGDRSYYFDSRGDFYSPTSVKTSAYALGSYDLTDPSVTLFSTIQDATAVAGEHIQVATGATETALIFTYPAADFIGGKITLIVKNNTTGSTSIVEYKIVNTASVVATGIVGTMLTSSGSSPIDVLGAQITSGNVEIGFDTSATNTATDVLAWKAKIELFNP
jgi:hypothetical protein